MSVLFSIDSTFLIYQRVFYRKIYKHLLVLDEPNITFMIDKLG